MQFGVQSLELPFFANLLILLVLARLFGEIMERFKQPAMIGEILAGVLLGPTILNFIHRTEELKVISELGVFLLVFSPFIHAESRGLLWEIKSGKQTAYIFGSIHVAKADFYPLPATVEAAYAQAATVAVEVDIDNPVQMQKATPFLTYGAGDKLENHLTPATWAKLTALTGSCTITKLPKQ